MSERRFDDFDDAGDDGEGGFNLGRIKAMVVRQKWWMVLPALLAMIPAGIYPFTLTDTYSATATVAVQARPQIMDMGGDFMPGEIATGRRRNPFAPVISIARSDQVLGRALDQMNGGPQEASVEADAKPRPRGWISRIRSGLMRLDWRAPEELSPEQIRRGTIAGLRESVEFDADDSVLYVVGWADTPDGAMLLANSVATALVTNESAQREEAATKALSYFRTQVFHLREQISRQKQAIAELIEKEGINPEASEQRELELARLEGESNEAQLRLFEVRSRIDELAPRVAIASGARGEAAAQARLREQYQEASLQLVDAQVRFRPEHPEVKRLKALVDRLEKDLDGKVVGPTEATPAESGEYARLELEERSLVTRIGRIQSEIRERKPNGRKAGAMIEYERLRRELQLDEANLAELMRRESTVLLEASSQFANLRLLDPAILPVWPSGPNRLQFLALGLALAVGLGVGVGVARDFLDQTIRDPEEAVEILGAPILGMIPLVHDGTPPERQSDGPPSSLSAESYRNLRTALLFSVGASNIGSLVVTSATAGEGKTTVTCNLASSFSQAGRSVLLIDADMRLPRQHKAMGVALSPGLSEVIRGDVSVDEALRRPADGRFDIITAGRVPPNPSELLASSDFSILLARLKAMYDLVLIDSPVMLGVSDTTIVGSQAEAMLLVHKPGSVEKRALREIRGMLSRVHVNLIGLAFNQVDRRDRHFYPMYMESPYVSKGKGVRLRTSPQRRFSKQWGVR